VLFFVNAFHHFMFSCTRDWLEYGAAFLKTCHHFYFTYRVDVAEYGVYIAIGMWIFGIGLLFGDLTPVVCSHSLKWLPFLFTRNKLSPCGSSCSSGFSYFFRTSSCYFQISLLEQAKAQDNPHCFCGLFSDSAKHSLYMSGNISEY